MEGARFSMVRSSYAVGFPFGPALEKGNPIQSIVVTAYGPRRACDVQRRRQRAEGGRRAGGGRTGVCGGGPTRGGTDLRSSDKLES